MCDLVIPLQYMRTCQKLRTSVRQTDYVRTLMGWHRPGRVGQNCTLLTQSAVPCAHSFRLFARLRNSSAAEQSG